jgi:beta-glucosidase
MRIRFCLYSLLALAAGLTVCIAAAQSAQPGRLSHAQAETRARHLVSQMTLDEKIAQLHGIHDATHYRMVPGLPRLGIPELHMTNGPAGVGPGGAGPQKPATALPAPIALAATWDPELSRAFGKLAAEETRSTGSQLFESPDINIARVPQGGRVFESYGEDPYLDSRIAVANIEGIQGTGMIANVKHFIANNQEDQRFVVDERIGERTLREIYMPAFEASIKEAHSASVMCAYPKINGTYNCENGPLLTDVLKKEWGFDGFALSDWGATHSTVASALGGLDLEMPTGRYFGDELRKAVGSGAVSVAVIDEMLVRRFAKMMEFGLFGPQPKPLPIPAFEHGAIARAIAAQSMVLLKNEGNILPLNLDSPLPPDNRPPLAPGSALPPARGRSVALIGPFAMRPNTGGGGSSHVIPLYAITPDDGLHAALDSMVRFSAQDGNDIDAAVAAAKKATVAIVMVGDEATEGHDHSIELAPAQNQLITAVAKANPKTIVVLKTGSAVLMPWINDVAAVLEAWYPGQEDGNAVADVLVGKVNPSGKLPLTFPRTVDQTLASHPDQYPGIANVAHYSEGLEVGYRAYAAHNVTPLFPFGFGLSYTQFGFDGLKVSRQPGSANTTVSFRVTNTGSRAGAEVAQLYLGFPPIAEGNEPPLQLKGFRKVMLNPGESKAIELKLDARAFSFWSEKTHAWQIAPGAFQIMVGDSSANTPLKTALTIQ